MFSLKGPNTASIQISPLHLLAGQLGFRQNFTMPQFSYLKIFNIVLLFFFSHFRLFQQKLPQIRWLEQNVQVWKLTGVRLSTNLVAGEDPHTVLWFSFPVC